MRNCTVKPGRLDIAFSGVQHCQSYDTTGSKLSIQFSLFIPFTGEFSQAIRKNTNITLGLYHSLYEWFHPFYMKDVANNFTTQGYVKVKLYNHA